MAIATIAGLSTLGVKFGIGYETSKGVKPETFDWMQRANAIGGFSIEPETIDASALEDLVDRTIAGRGKTGGSFSVTFNATSETIEAIEEMISTYNENKKSDLQMWSEVYHPSMQRAWFCVVEPPQAIPQPQMDQNGLMTIEIPFAISDYKGLQTAIEPTA